MPRDEAATEETQRNVMSEPLSACCLSPTTGFYRTGYCETGPEDRGAHVVCAEVTREFLEFSKRRGNDLTTPRPEWQFPGLQPGDRWCVVAGRWLQSYQAGVAAPVVLASTNYRALEVIPIEVLTEHSVDVPPDVSGLD